MHFDEADQQNIEEECPQFLIWKLSWASKEKKAFRKMFGRGKLKKMVEDHSINAMYLNFESEEELSYDLETIIGKTKIDFIVTSSGRTKIEIKGFSFVASHECEEMPTKYKSFTRNFLDGRNSQWQS